MGKFIHIAVRGFWSRPMQPPVRWLQRKPRHFQRQESAATNGNATMLAKHANRAHGFEARRGQAASNVSINIPNGELDSATPRVAGDGEESLRSAGDFCDDGRVEANEYFGQAGGDEDSDLRLR